MKRYDFDGLTAVNADRTVAASLSVVQDFDRPVGAEYIVSVDLDGRRFTGEAGDAFWALVRTREQYEPLGWRLAVQGASVLCYPSGMQGGSGGWAVYRHETPLQEGLPVPVPTFDPAPVDEIVTVAEQDAAHQARIAAWVRSRSA